ncbi:DUF4190 domain-containing protein [Nonomuraea sp. SYSU D8015]|uniref:DUF4190 domain-containing protein n=1 Tax=Nonomuraea sp. SYSU D8015 TaxID=2593644 RepID=UPI001660CE5A|nr:DUF4190 domain-containing protein [Nonomuraea sp. SYSU D8015]
MSYPNYGPPHYGPQYTHPNGTTILVLGILSLVVCGLLGPFAWSMGNKALREIDESGYPYENRGYVQAGRICGIISTVLLIIGFAFVILMFAIMLITGGLAASSSF